MSTKQLAGLIGFLFIAAWVAFGFGDAILCLIGAGVFYTVAAFYTGDLDVTELQNRARQPRGR